MPGPAPPDHHRPGAPHRARRTPPGPCHLNPGRLQEPTRPQVGIGRWDSPDRWTPLIDADGFLSTGDLGELDADGRLRLCGRISTFIKRHGYRIDPREIECFLEEHPAVAGAVVVGLPDPLAGKKIVACVATAREIEGPELLSWCRRHLSTHKVPQLTRVVAALPRLASGKADRREAARLLGG